MSLSSTTPHGAVTARLLPQLGISSPSMSRTSRTLSLESSMPPPTRLLDSRSVDTQPSSSIQRDPMTLLTTREDVSSTTSRHGSVRTPRLTRPPSQLLPLALRISEQSESHQLFLSHPKQTDK